MSAGRRLTRSAALAAVVLALTGCARSEPSLGRAASVPLHLTLFGFNDNAVAQGLIGPAADARSARAAGANALRVTLDWHSVERSPGSRDFSLYDALYHAMLHARLRPVWVVLFSPAWTHPGVCPVAQPACPAPPQPAYDGAWKSFIATVARRYPRAAGIEIWNEPNYAAFWFPRPDALRYAVLLSEAYHAVKASAPQIPVVAGGVGNKPVSVGGPDVGLAEFTRALFAAGGGHSMDALGVHPYPQGTDEAPVSSSLAEVRAIRDRYGFRHLPLWATETGVSTTGPTAVSPDQQAAELIDLYRRIGGMRDVQALFVHTLFDPPGSPSDIEAGYGVLSSGGAPKPGFGALARTVRASGR